MSKIALILMFLMIGLTIISGQAYCGDDLSCKLSYNPDIDKDHEKGDKKIKDYAFTSNYNNIINHSFNNLRNLHQFSLFPSPIIDTHTPPPDYRK